MRKFIIAATFAFAGAAFAAGSISVDEDADVKGTPADVWAKVGGWCAIADWHPALEKCEEGTAGGMKTRTLTLKGGGTIKETMTASSATGYSYRIDESPLPVKDYTADFAVKADGSGSEISWKASFNPVGDSSAAKKAIEGVFTGGLDNIEKMMK